MISLSYTGVSLFNKFKIKWSIFIDLGLILMSIFALIYPALENKFPIIHADTGTYIASGFEEYVPKDRPIFYGLLLKMISFNNSLWYLVLFQAMVTYLVIYLFINRFVKTNYTVPVVFVVICFLSFFTGLSYYVSQAIPDIFCPLGLIAMVLFFDNYRLSVAKVLFLLAIVFISSVTHFSHLLANTVFVFCALIVFVIFKNVRKNVKIWNLGLLVLSIILSWIGLKSINSYYSDESEVAKYKSIIIGARLNQLGILQEYLENECAESDYSFCDHIQELKENPRPQYFVWNHNSPLYSGDCLEHGVMKCWKEKGDELDEILFNIVSTGKYQRKLFGKAFTGMVQQFFSIELAVFPPLLEGSSVSYPMKTYLPSCYEEYKMAGQSGNKLQFTFQNMVLELIIYFSMALSLLVIAYSLWKKRRNFFIILHLGAFYLFLLINAFFCANFSNVVGRYQGRVAWVIPMVLICLLFVNLRKVYFVKENKNV